MGICSSVVKVLGLEGWGFKPPHHHNPQLGSGARLLTLSIVFLTKKESKTTHHFLQACSVV